MVKKVLNVLAIPCLGLGMLFLPVHAAASEAHSHSDAHSHKAESTAHQDGHPHQTVSGGNLQEPNVSASEIYEQFCSVCHGDEGNGKSRAQGGLIPPPKDFTSPQVAAELSRERMIDSVTHGRRGTAMAAWKDRLSENQVAAVVDYIRDQFMPAVTTDRSSDGRRIFAEYCSVCHGDRGQGAVWANNGLKPPPANFTSPAKQKELSRDRMIFSVTYGRPQTAMAAWGKRLSPEEVESVVDYVRHSIMKLDEPDMMAGKGGGHEGHEEHGDHGGAGGHDHDAHGVQNINDPFENGLVGSFERGQELYKENCVACHGSEGDGAGPRAYFIFPKPRDFSHPAARAKYSRPHLFIVVSDGEIGSEMPAWRQVLSDEQIADVSEYVFRKFIRPES